MRSFFVALFSLCTPLVGALTAIDDSNFHVAVTAYLDDSVAATTTYGDIGGTRSEVTSPANACHCFQF